MTRIQIEAILLASPLHVKVGVLLGRQEVVIADPGQIRRNRQEGSSVK